MTNKNNAQNIWKDVIVNFFETRVENIQNSNPKIPCKIYKARKYIEDKTEEIRLEKQSVRLEKLIKAKNEKEADLAKFRIAAPSTEIRLWIDKASQTKIAEGKRIIKATHVLRFTHSSSFSDGILVEDKSNEPILSTTSLGKQCTFDMAHNNGALITISRFLALNINGASIIDLIIDGNYCFLKEFSENQEQFDRWCIGFSKLVEVRSIARADKVKQIYFPLINKNLNINTEEVKYHLVTPLFSSSLAESIFNFVSYIKYSDEQEMARKAIKNTIEKPSTYYQKSYVDVSNLGIQKFGGAQPQNVSMLNKNRGGVNYLFSSQPPTWKSQIKPPIFKQSFFYAMPIDKNTRTTLDHLQSFVVRHQRLDLSIKDPKFLKWLDKWTSEIIDEVLGYAANIQNLQPGWSNADDIKLKLEHQYFLDPYRDDEVYQAARKASDFHTVICKDFAQWLNRLLIGKEKQFTPQREHRRLWIAFMDQPLRDYIQTIEQNFKAQERE